MQWQALVVHFSVPKS